MRVSITFFMVACFLLSALHGPNAVMGISLGSRSLKKDSYGVPTLPTVDHKSEIYGTYKGSSKHYGSDSKSHSYEKEIGVKESLKKVEKAIKDLVHKSLAKHHSTLKTHTEKHGEKYSHKDEKPTKGQQSKPSKSKGYGLKKGSEYGAGAKGPSYSDEKKSKGSDKKSGAKDHDSSEIYGFGWSQSYKEKDRLDFHTTLGSKIVLKSEPPVLN
ncbi:hypothetical protein CROQUDRAFT_660690 [Cronartium quercuum f. sp. fusiforme G11]|uniref:Uncharacterized protein n=1 Tax=Cronartium quercuum f. sp. fusiforme G11 TaxID=708437 RepID=A0A9P6NE23_9BASI|nr:hypothetical protein CROQUDRAFT_660690 [Cronartium quercuum f. sp. fusiforme G11]